MDKKQYKTIWGLATLRKDGRYQITSRKEGNKGKLLHRLIWENSWGKLPNNYVIHHLDENPKNNCLLNLCAMPKSQHNKIHTLNEESKQKLSHKLKGRKKSTEHCKKISEAKKGCRSPMFGVCGTDSPLWKHYARIIKKGVKSGKQTYGLMFNGETIKYSIHPEKLERWFLQEYPLEIMECI